MVMRSRLLVAVVATTLVVGTTFSGTAGADPLSLQNIDDSRPSGAAMVVDAVIVRPVMAVSSLLGSGLFLVSLPFSLIGGNTTEALDALVVTPVEQTFLRCLGCTPTQSDRLRAESKAAKAAKEESVGETASAN